MKTFIKKKSKGVSPKVGFRTSDFIKESRFSNKNYSKQSPKFNPGQFKIQHKG